MLLFPISFPPWPLLSTSRGEESAGGGTCKTPEPFKHLVNSEFLSPRAKIYIFMVMFCFSGVPPVLSFSEEMGWITCIGAGTGKC